MLLIIVLFALIFSNVHCYTGKNHLVKTTLFKTSGGYTSSNFKDALKSQSPHSESTVAEKLKLIYFDGRGAAELARLILKILNIDFTDERCTAKMENGTFYIQAISIC